MTLKKKITRTIKAQILKLVAQIVYFTGLTALIPLVPLFLSPTEFIRAKYAVIAALIFIALSFILILWATHSKKQAFFTLGLMTLLPGLLAVLFAYVGERRMIIFVSKLGHVTPFVQHWVDAYIPKTWLLAGIYIIIGVVFVWISQD